MEINNKRIVFHGTANKNFTKFNNFEIGLGGDPNSNLGVFFSETPFLASDYSGENGLIIVSAIPDNPSIRCIEEFELFNDDVLKLANYDCLLNNYDLIEEIPNFEEYDNYRTLCSFARDYYIEKKAKILEYTHISSDEQICVCLNANDIEILCTLKPLEAINLQKKFDKLNDIYNQNDRFNLLTKFINKFNETKPKFKY